MSEQKTRRHRRIQYSGPVRVSWPAGNGVDKYLTGKCLDVSEGGLLLEATEQIPLRTLVVLRAERLKLSGYATVRHIEHKGIKYVIGFELTQPLRRQPLEDAVETTSKAGTVPTT